MNPLQDLGMTTKQFIKELGGAKSVGAYVGVSQPSISGWVKRGVVPDQQMVLLAPLAEKRGIATRKQLLPLTYQKIWMELS